MKLSMDLIKHMERAGSWKDFRRDYDIIHDEKGNKSYANTFAGMLEISMGLDVLGEDYLIIGGMAVAAYLYQVDPQAFRNWRGTDDIDLLVIDKGIAERVLKSADYEFRGVLNNKPGVIGQLFDYAKEDNGETTVVGLRAGVADGTGKDITRKLLNHRAIIPVHGVQVAVPQLRALVEMKRSANRAKDREDIKTIKYLTSRI